MTVLVGALGAPAAMTGSGIGRTRSKTGSGLGIGSSRWRLSPLGGSFWRQGGAQAFRPSNRRLHVQHTAAVGHERLEHQGGRALVVLRHWRNVRQARDGHTPDQEALARVEAHNGGGIGGQHEGIVVDELPERARL